MSDFDDMLPRLTAGLDHEPENDMSKSLSANEIRILGLVLGIKHLSLLRENGLDLEGASPSGRLTKEHVAMHLRKIGQEQLAQLLSEKRGIQNLQSEIYRNVYINALKDPKSFTIDLQILKMILCGVPRAGKSTFWRRLVKDDFDTDKLSESTLLAEHHYIHVSVKTAMLYDWHLCYEDDGPDSDGDLDKEALVIYKKIIDGYSNSSKDNMLPATPSVNSTLPPPSSQKQEVGSYDSSEFIQDDLTINEQESDQSEIYKKINAIFTDLERRLTRLSDGEVPDISRVRRMFNLIDTGGQRAFLELLPVLSIGKALYLIFFSYGNPLNKTLQDKYQGPEESFDLDNEYNQMEVILQSLRCVSTTSYADEALTENKDTGVTALLVGTHTDEQCKQPDIAGNVDDYIQTEVKGFLDSDTKVLEYAHPRQLVLKVNNKTKNNDEFERYRKMLVQVVDRKFSHNVKKLPGSWLMFSIILRKMKLAGWSVLPYEHCKYIASKLFIPLATLEALLSFMHRDLGILMHFPDVPCLKSLVICDPDIVFTSISEVIIKTFTEDVLTKSRDSVREYHHFTEHGVFAYQKVRDLTEGKRGILGLDKLIVLLQHIGIIAPIEFSEPDPTFKCRLDHNCQTDSLHCIHADYIIPCVLKGTKPDELTRIEQHCSKSCTIAPLIITFECKFAPMGGFCYLFTKLITDHRPNWKPYLPDVNSSGECPVERIIRRNKVTFFVDEKFYVTLVSTAQYYKVFIEHRPGRLQLGYEFVCYEVWKAIKDALSDCLNPQVRHFKVAFQCTEHQRNYEHNDGHLMVLQQNPHCTTNSANLALKAKCENDKGNFTIDATAHAVMVWFQGPFRFVQKPLETHQQSSFGEKITLKVSTVPNIDCSYKWKRIGKGLEADSWCSGFETDTLRFKYFCKEYEGIYTCTVTDSNDKDYSESLSVKLTYTGPEKFDIKMKDEDFYAYLNGQELSLKDCIVLRDNAIGAKIFSEESIPKEVSTGGEWVLKKVLKDNLKPKIIEQPRSLAKYCDEEASFKVNAEEPSGTLSYQWQKDGIDVVDDSRHSGAKNCELTIQHLQSQHAGRYCCIVENEHGQKKSNIACLSLKVKITEQPRALSRPYKGEAMIRVLATGQEPLTYKWKKDGRDIYNNDNYHGVDSHQFTIKTLTGKHEGSYSCVVINDVSKEESDKATLSVEGDIVEQVLKKTPTGQKKLNAEDLHSVWNAVFELRARWLQLGIQLKISRGSLEAYDGQHQGDPHKCLADVLLEWLRRSEPPPTWDALRDALKSHSMRHH